MRPPVYTMCAQPPLALGGLSACLGRAFRFNRSRVSVHLTKSFPRNGSRYRALALSETPEFWRAAPEAAVQWSAEEFGFPPEAAEQSRGTNLGLPPPVGDGAVEPEDSPLAVGLLRASGMQI